MGRASSQPKSLSISSSAPSSRPFSGAGPAPTRLNISAKTLFSFSTAPFPLSFTRPKVVRWSNSTTRITRFATSARNIDSFSPWCTKEANSCSPTILASWSLALKSAAVREANAAESNWGASPTVATSCPVRSTSNAQRAFDSRRNACKCCWICLKSFSENDQLAAPAITCPRSVGLGHVPPGKQRLRDRHAIGVLEIPAHREAPRDAGHPDPRRFEELLEVGRRDLALHRGVGGDDHLPYPRAVRDALQQPVEPQRLGAHPLKRGEPPAQHMITPAEAAGALDRGHVRGFLHHAQHARLATRIAADRTRVLVGERAAHPARPHPLPHGADRLRQPRGALHRLLQQEKREPLRRLPSDPGELRQLRHEIIDGRHGGLQRQLKRERQARGELLHFRLVQLGGALLRLRHGGEHEVLEHFHVPLGDDLGVDLDGADLPPPVGRGLYHPPARRAGHGLLRQLRLDLRQPELHLLPQLEQAG